MTVTEIKLCTYMWWHTFHTFNFQNLCIYVFNLIVMPNNHYFPQQHCIKTMYLKLTLNLSDIGMTQHVKISISNLNISVLT